MHFRHSLLLASIVYQDFHTSAADSVRENAIAQSRDEQIPLKAAEQTFNWKQVQPSKQLEYTPCYDDFQCARLDVPLNWNASGEERENQRAAVAVIRLPAKVPVTDSRYGGAIIVNPGGPGESGIDNLISRGRAIQAIVDVSSAPPEEEIGSDLSGKFFDIISFDPRAVKYTTPSLQCFTDAFSQQMWLLTRPDYGSLFDSNTSLALEWTRTEALGQACLSTINGTSMAPYANTPQVVEDIVDIVEKHGEWRQAEAERRIVQQRLILNLESSPWQIKQTLDRTVWRIGVEKIQYIGYSYGTLLGQTLAAMHPERVGRLLIDGVVDPDDYYHGTWMANLQDSDKVMSKLSEYCFEAGPSKCPLAAVASPNEVEEKLTSLLFDLKLNPVAVTGSSSSDPIAITFDDFYLQAIGAMAFPAASAENFFRIVAELEKGNVTRIASMKQMQIDNAASLARCRSSSDHCMPENYFGLIAGTPIIECMDNAFYRGEDLTKGQFITYFEKLAKQSKWFSPAWARHRMACIGIKSSPVWRFDGSITGNTSHPLLIIGNTYDTVTPIRNARRVSTLFQGSVVLQQDSQGHCSHSNPSSCTALHVRQYFQTGELPSPNTICKPDWLPFLGPQQVRDQDVDEGFGQALWHLARTQRLSLF